MNCEFIHLIFSREESSFFSTERDAQIKALFVLGRIKRIGIDFLTEICDHPLRPSQILWQEIPIIQINCLGTRCIIEVLNNKDEILSYLIQPIIQHSNLRYISILTNLRLPSWNKYSEFIVVLNRVGNIFLLPTKENFSETDIHKLKKRWKILVENTVIFEDDLDLIDVLAPQTFPKSDFRVLI